MVGMPTTKSATRSFITSVDLPATDRAKVIKILNQHLADASDFWQLHKLFDEVAGEAAGWVDEFAERVTALGGYATGTVRMAASSSRLPEFPTDITDSMAYVKAVATRLAAFSNSAREAIEATDKLEDANTADLFTEVSRCADKYLYFLEAHLQD